MVYAIAYGGLLLNKVSCSDPSLRNQNADPDTGGKINLTFLPWHVFAHLLYVYNN